MDLEEEIKQIQNSAKIKEVEAKLDGRILARDLMIIGDYTNQLRWEKREIEREVKTPAFAPEEERTKDLANHPGYTELVDELHRVRLKKGGMYQLYFRQNPEILKLGSINEMMKEIKKRADRGE